VTLDPIVLATGIGIVASPVAGRAVVHGFESVPRRWRRPTIWLLVLGAAAPAAMAELAPEGPVKAAVFVILLGALRESDRQLAPRRAMVFVASLGLLVAIVWFSYEIRTTRRIPQKQHAMAPRRGEISTAGVSGAS
jgi:hypothetical protein